MCCPEEERLLLECRNLRCVCCRHKLSQESEPSVGSRGTEVKLISQAAKRVSLGGDRGWTCTLSSSYMLLILLSMISSPVEDRLRKQTEYMFGVLYRELPWWLSSKESAFNAGDAGSIPGLEMSLGGGYGNPLQYSCLEMSWTEEPGGLRSTGLRKSRTRLKRLKWQQIHFRTLPGSLYLIRAK